MSNLDNQHVIRDEYDRTAGEYDQRWGYYINATRRETMKRLPAESPERVVDVACGTGALPESLLEKNEIKSVVGVDLSSRMLREAESKLGNLINLSQGSADSIPITSGYADWVVCCNSFHFFDEPERFLTESWRILKPGGTLAVTDWCDDFLACQLCDWYLRLTDRAHTRLFGREELRRMVMSAGFEIMALDAYKIDWLWGLMTVRAKKSDR